jgi:PAS domain S-box-containing protein
VVGLAATGEDAIRMTEELQPDVVLMDVCLRGFVWTVQPDAATGRLRTQAYAGATEGLLAWTARQCAAGGETLFTTVLRTERPLVTPEPLAGAPGAPASAGSVAIVPMRHGERSYGCLCVHSIPPDQFGDEEIDLLEELAGDLAFALRGLEEETSRKRAERALEESHESWRRLVEYQPTGNVVHRDGVILYANEACLRIVGLRDRNDAVGRAVVDFVHPDSRAFVAGRLQELAQGGEPGTNEVKLARRDGEPVVVEMTSHRVTYQGQPAIQTVFSDVTDRRRSEEQLRRAQKLDSVGRLAAGVAHDFNNMLLAIIGHTQLLTETLHASDPRVEHGEAILAAAHRCSDLSRQLLAFSRRQVLDLRIVDLREVVTRVEALLRGTLREDVRRDATCGPEPGYGRGADQPAPPYQRSTRSARSVIQRLGRPTPSSIAIGIWPGWLVSSDHAPWRSRFERTSVTASALRGSGATPASRR